MSTLRYCSRGVLRSQFFDFGGHSLYFGQGGRILQTSLTCRISASQQERNIASHGALKQVLLAYALHCSEITYIWPCSLMAFLCSPVPSVVAHEYAGDAGRRRMPLALIGWGLALALGRSFRCESPITPRQEKSPETLPLRRMRHYTTTP